MFNQTLSTVAISLVPYWSADITKKLVLGNEYNMAITVLFGEIIKFTMPFVSDTIAINIIIIMCIIMVLPILGVPLLNPFKNWIKCEKHTIKFVGADTDTGLKYTPEMRDLNSWILANFKIISMKYINSIKVIDTLDNFKLDGDIYITVTRNPSNVQNVTYILTSSSDGDMSKFIQRIYDLENPHKNRMVLVGLHTDNRTMFTYSPNLMALVYKIQTTVTTVPFNLEKSIADPAPIGPCANIWKQMPIIMNKRLRFELESDIIVDIEQVDNTVRYTLLSNTTDLNAYLENVSEYVKNVALYNSPNPRKYIIEFVGTETATSYTYPTIMVQITHELIKTYGFTSLKLLEKNIPSNATYKYESTDDGERKEKRKEDKLKHDIAMGDTESLSNVCEYIVESCTNVQLGKTDVYITINRNEPGIVRYSLSSETVNLQSFIESAIITNMLKSKDESGISRLTIKYSSTSSNVNDVTNINAMLYFMIEVHKVKNVTLFANTTIQSKFTLPYLLAQDVCIRVDSIDFVCKTINDYTLTVMQFKLESETIDVVDYFTHTILPQYQTFMKNKLKGTLYHFILTEVTTAGDLVFDKKILSDENDPYNATFKHLYSPHTELLKADLDRLKNAAYYARTGLRCKKTYIFHGPPGTGKSAGAVAMALYDKRHIIEFQFGTLKTNVALIKLLNLTQINNIEISKRSVLYLADEIDVKHLMPVYVAEQPKSTGLTDQILAEFMCTKLPNAQDMNINTILSQIDGAGNNNGLTFVATTNNISDLPPAMIREMRMTPLEFGFARAVDVRAIIEKHFECVLSADHVARLPDKKYPPVKIICMCEKYADVSMNEFIDILSPPMAADNGPDSPFILT